MFPRQKFSRSENFCLGRQSFMVALLGDGIDTYELLGVQDLSWTILCY